MAATEEPQLADVCDFNHEDLVTLLVGAEQKRMVVHGTYLARDSEFFKAALKKEWTEGQTRTISLPEQCHEVMAHYMSYTYSKRLSSKDKAYNEMSDFEHVYATLATLYVYGKRFTNPTIQKSVIKEFLRLTHIDDISGSTWNPSEDEVNIIYRGTPENSPARRLMIDLHVSGGDKNWICEKLEPAFLVDLAIALYDRCPGNDKSITLKLEDYI